jgi:hypothetical protein
MSKLLNTNGSPFIILAAVLLSVGLVALVTQAASTISTNITTAGDLTVSGNSIFGDAATDVNLFTGTLQATTTALFTAGLTTYGASVFNEDGADVDFRVESNGNTHMLFVDAGNDRVGVASSTPIQDIGVTGDIAMGSGATTTLSLDSTAASTGGCLQMRGANGTTYAAYIVATTSSQGVNGSWYIKSGKCQ